MPLDFESEIADLVRAIDVVRHVAEHDVTYQDEQRNETLIYALDELAKRARALKAAYLGKADQAAE